MIVSVPIFLYGLYQLMLNLAGGKGAVTDMICPKCESVYKMRWDSSSTCPHDGFANGTTEWVLRPPPGAVRQASNRKQGLTPNFSPGL
jgi:hypothetical protein